MVKSTVPTRPNKYWPGVVAIGLVSLFIFLSVSNQKHSTTSGDNIHKFSNGGTYRDGSKCITYNRNSPLAYNGSSSNNTLFWLCLLGLSMVWVAFCGYKSVTGQWGGCQHDKREGNYLFECFE
uniref:p14 n=1 Tax=Peanut clump virus N TaxID=188886 RepID=Q8B0Y5_9VIRU|nr:P14 [Peanut clump virus N]